jgi:sulfite reductase (NADPH) flavoprotein alpha-component
VVSTTGEGDAPDTARAFIRDVMSAEPALHGLGYGVLALGDSGYDRFCAFGRTLDAWLARRGAAPLFDRVEVDDGDPAALRHWQSHVGVLAGVTDAPDWTRPRYGRWRLVQRRRLNPGGPGDAAFHLRLESIDTATWEAGDILEVGPRNDPAEVAALLARLGLDPAASVIAEDAATLAEACPGAGCRTTRPPRPRRPRPWSTPCRPCPTANIRSPRCRPTAASSCWSGP